MKKILVCLLALAAVFSLSFTAFAGEAAEEKDLDPIVGSWKLDAVFDMSDPDASALMDKEEHQSFYGSGLSILTFNEDGTASNTMFGADEMFDVEASWTGSDGTYEYTEGDTSMTLVYNAEEDALHRSFTDDNNNLDFIYTRAIVGSWKLDKVVEIHEGDAPVDLPKEENQSLYGNSENVLTFMNAEHKTIEVIQDGEDSIQVEGTYEITAPDVYTYKVDDTSTEFNYFRLDDTLYYDVFEEGETPRQLRFVYARCDAPAAAEGEEAVAE